MINHNKYHEDIFATLLDKEMYINEQQQKYYEERIGKGQLQLLRNKFKENIDKNDNNNSYREYLRNIKLKRQKENYSLTNTFNYDGI